jgi:hypothetical protein
VVRIVVMEDYKMKVASIVQCSQHPCLLNFDQAHNAVSTSQVMAATSNWAVGILHRSLTCVLIIKVHSTALACTTHSSHTKLHHMVTGNVAVTPGTTQSGGNRM